MADRHNFTFVEAAVAKKDGEMQLTTKPEAKMSATILERDKAVTAGATAIQYSVRTVDLSGYLRTVLPAVQAESTPTLAYLKLDVEGIEYTLLPFLLTSGALCRFSHVRIEWHLVAQAIPERFESLALRHSIGRLLRLGCAVAPQLLEHEEFPANNFAFPVPGIQEVAALHTIWAGSKAGGIHTSTWTSGKLHWDAVELRHEHSPDGERRCAAAPPVCVGFCGLDKLRCSWNATASAYKEALRSPISAQSAAARGVGLPWILAHG